jgi:hypothetical protein
MLYNYKEHIHNIKYNWDMSHILKHNHAFGITNDNEITLALWTKVKRWKFLEKYTSVTWKRRQTATINEISFSPSLKQEGNRANRTAY